MAEHFPTFRKISGAVSAGVGGIARGVDDVPRWAGRLARYERRLLRGTLYFLLVSAVVAHVIYHLAISGVLGEPFESLYTGRRFGMQQFTGFQFAIWLITSLVGPPFTPIVIVLCVGGLAASMNPVAASFPRSEPARAPRARDAAPLSAPSSVPAEEFAPPAAARHPLDPSPDDPPYKPAPWRK